MRREDPDRAVANAGRRIAELRGDRGMTQEALAETLEVSVKYVQRIEGGGTNLTIKSLIRIANALRADVRTLFDPPETSRDSRRASRSPRRRGKRSR